MPKSAQQILDAADLLVRRFEQHEPSDNARDAKPLKAVRAAFLLRAQAERELQAAVVAARHEGHTWASIGAMVGTSGEAARQRYAQHVSAA